MTLQLESQTEHFSMALSLVNPQEGKRRNSMYKKKSNTLPVFHKWIDSTYSFTLPTLPASSE